MVDLDELERLLNEATPQDWIAHPPRVYIGLLEGRPAYVDFCNTPNMDANANLIAALRNAAPELIKMAKRYQWLRNDNAYAPEEWGIRGEEELDELIDRLMASEKLRSQEESR